MANVVVEPRLCKGKVLVKGLALGLRARLERRHLAKIRQGKTISQRFGFGTKGKVGNNVVYPSIYRETRRSPLKFA